MKWSSSLQKRVCKFALKKSYRVGYRLSHLYLGTSIQLVSAFPQTDIQYISALPQTDITFQHVHLMNRSFRVPTDQHYVSAFTQTEIQYITAFTLTDITFTCSTDRYFRFPTDQHYVSAFPQTNITFERSHRQALLRGNAILCCHSHLGS